MAMDLTLTRNFNQNEKVATLKLMIKIASSDGEISDSEKATLGEFLQHTKLKTNENFVKNAVGEDVSQIISVFESKANLQRAQKLAYAFAEKHGIDPDFEGALLETINKSVDSEKKNMKFSINRFLKEMLLEFGYLWGKDDVNPRAREILAIILTVCACGLIAFSTSSHWFGKDTTSFVYPGISASFCGLLIFSALSVRGYLPKPTSFKNILFAAANLALLSYVAYHIIGNGIIEKTVTFYVFFGLIILLWLGIKEIVGFAFIGFFLLCGYKVISLETHISWRAFPFIFSAFMGIGFQSANFFDDFGNFTNSMLKKANVDKKLLKEGVEIAGQQTKKAVNSTVQSGITAAKLYAGRV